MSVRLCLVLVLASTACRASGIPHSARDGCHPACPGAEEARIDDAGAALRGEPPREQASNPAPSSAAYLCPMHLWIGSDTPGRCPQCNMELVPRAQALEHAHGG
jgi:hypothetical protein